MYLKSGVLVFGVIAVALFWMGQPVPTHQAAVDAVVVDKRDAPNDSAAPVVQAESQGGLSPAERVRDPFIGTWTGECGDQVQCSLDIEIVGKNYILDLQIADWQKVDAVTCRLRGSMGISKDGQYLAGKMGSSPLSGAFLRGAGVLELHDMPDADCGRPFALDGIYRIVGD